MKDNIEIPVMDQGEKQAVQVMIPDYAVILAEGTYPVQSKYFRIYVGTSAITMKINHMGVVNANDVGTPIGNPFEYFGAQIGDTITISGGSVTITWGY